MSKSNNTEALVVVVILLILVICIYIVSAVKAVRDRQAKKRRIAQKVASEWAERSEKIYKPRVSITTNGQCTEYTRGEHHPPKAPRVISVPDLADIEESAEDEEVDAVGATTSSQTTNLSPVKEYINEHQNVTNNAAFEAETPGTREMFQSQGILEESKQQQDTHVSKQQEGVKHVMQQSCTIELFQPQGTLELPQQQCTPKVPQGEGAPDLSPQQHSTLQYFKEEGILELFSIEDSQELVQQQDTLEELQHAGFVEVFQKRSKLKKFKHKDTLDVSQQRGPTEKSRQPLIEESHQQQCSPATPTVGTSLLLKEASRERRSSAVLGETPSPGSSNISHLASLEVYPNSHPCRNCDLDIDDFCHITTGTNGDPNSPFAAHYYRRHRCDIDKKSAASSLRSPSLSGSATTGQTSQQAVSRKSSILSKPISCSTDGRTDDVEGCEEYSALPDVQC